MTTTRVNPQLLEAIARALDAAPEAALGQREIVPAPTDDRRPRSLQYRADEMGPLTVRDAAPHYLGQADCRHINRLLFVVVNTTNVPIDVQVVGTDIPTPAPGLQFAIGASVTVDAGKTRSIVVNVAESWHPWMGLSIVAPAAPSSGVLSAVAHCQTWEA